MPVWPQRYLIFRIPKTGSQNPTLCPIELYLRRFNESSDIGNFILEQTFHYGENNSYFAFTPFPIIMNYLITGGHTGIGLELSQILLQEGHSLSLIVRNEKRKEAAIQSLGHAGQVQIFIADLSIQAQVHRVADEILGHWKRIDGIFNNAGLLADQAYVSEQGNEMQLEINALAPYLLTRALKPALDKAESPFVINTGTGGLHNQKELDIPELVKPTKFVKLMGSYLKSKMAMTLLLNTLAEEWKGVRIATVDPGPNKTGMTSGSGMPAWLVPIRNIFFAKPIVGAKKLYKGAFDPVFQDQSGVYISGNKVKALNLKWGQVEIQELFPKGLSVK
ncbi:MAG: SDR family NAD(P)-dependent oxidoreductase [Bacteroidota bacterium]